MKNISLFCLIITSFFGTTNLCANSYCYRNDWIYLAGGTVLGATAGAITGYAAGYQRSRRGKEGKPGPKGDPGESILIDVTHEIKISAENELAKDSHLLFDYAIYNPAGVPLKEHVWVYPGMQITPYVIERQCCKLTGTYCIVLCITDELKWGPETGLCTFSLNGQNFEPPVPCKKWNIGERFVITAPFQPASNTKPSPSNAE